MIERIAAPLSRRFWFALLAVPALLVLLSIEREAAWRSVGDTRTQSALDAGLHPDVFDFSARAQLIGGTIDGGEITLLARGGMLLQPRNEHVVLALKLSDALIPSDLATLKIEGHARAQSTDVLPQRLAIIAETAALLGPDAAKDAVRIRWRSELLSQLNQAIAFSDLLLSPENSQAGGARAWSALPRVQYLQIYLHAPSLAPFIIDRVSLQLQPEARARIQAERATLSARYTHFGSLPPLALLAIVLLWIYFVQRVRRQLEFGQPAAMVSIAALVFVPPFLLLNAVWGFSAASPFEANAVQHAHDIFHALRELRLSPNQVSHLAGFVWLLLWVLLVVAVARQPSTLPAMLDQGSQNRLILIGLFSVPLVLLLSTGWPAKTISLPRLGGYLVFALVQQFVLQRVLLNMLLGAFTPAFAALLAALLFALWHSPNMALMLICFVLGLYACGLALAGVDWRRIALLHALVGTALVQCLPPHILLNTEIGARHFLLGQSER